MSATVEPASSRAKLVPARLHPGDLGAGGERGAAHAAIARGAVGARDRDRGGGDRGGARPVLLLPGGLLEEIDKLGTNLLT